MSEIRTRSASKRKQSEDPDWNNQDDRRKRAPALGEFIFKQTFSTDIDHKFHFLCPKFENSRFYEFFLSIRYNAMSE